jgi:hypothetical protein
MNRLFPNILNESNQHSSTSRDHLHLLQFRSQSGKVWTVELLKYHFAVGGEDYCTLEHWMGFAGMERIMIQMKTDLLTERYILNQEESCYRHHTFHRYVVHPVTLYLNGSSVLYVFFFRRH